MSNALINFLLLLYFKPSVFNLYVLVGFCIFLVYFHFPLLLVHSLSLQLLYHSSEGTDQIEVTQVAVLLSNHYSGSLRVA